MVRNATIRAVALLAILTILGTLSLAAPYPPIPPPALSYWDRIHNAVEASAISEEQGLVYSVTALFAPERLPRPFALGQRGKCGTPVLVEAEARWTTLPGWVRDALAQWPVAAGARGLKRADTRPVLSGPERTLTSAHFVIHYTLSGTDAVDTGDANQNGVPDYVDAVAQAMEYSRLVQVEMLDWLEPPSDENTDPNSPLYDVYIAYLSVYGLTFPEAVKGDNEHSPDHLEPFARTSYIALHSRLSLSLLQVTAAHEYQHAIQFGYNAVADGFDARRWLMEGTATWMEDQVYDDINDNIGYLPRLFAAPDRSLADPQNHYASWILFQYLEEHAGGAEVVREMWERGVPLQGDFSAAVIHDALAARGHNFGDTFLAFCSANVLLSPCELAPGPFCYEEALLYREHAGRATAEGTATVANGQWAYIPPDGVQPLACDAIRIVAQSSQVAASGYSGAPGTTLAAAWLGIRESAAEVFAVPMQNDPPPPQSAVYPNLYDDLYLIVANVTDSTATLAWAPYGLILVGGDAPTPTPTATPSATPTLTPTPSATPTRTPTPGAPKRLWLPVVAAE